jgi:5'-nucleotidase
MAGYLNNRRNFIKNVSLGSAAFGLGQGLITSAKPSEELIILHTNDVHSHIHAFEKNHSRYAGAGGAIKRSLLIDSYRKQYKNILLLDAGDIFQGTPFFNFYGGELEMKLMTKMGYDAATLGNHDFDGGIDGLLKAKKYGKFDFLNANYVIENELKNIVKPYKVFKKGKIKVGVFGIGIELEGLVDPKLCAGIIYTEPISKANKIATHLKEKMDCDYVVCLSHLGLKYESDKVSDITLANNSQHIDLIIGGHTHSFLDEPLRLKNKNGEETLVSQAAWAGLRLGIVKVEFTKELKTSAGITTKV